MTDHQTTATDRLTAYLAGELAPAERDAVQQTLETDPNVAAEYARLCRAVEAIPVLVVPDDGARMAERVQRALNKRERLHGQPSSSKASARTRIVRWGAGAALAATLVATLVAYQRGLLSSAGANHAGGTQYITHTGQHAIVRLADGSRVHLAPQTTLRIEPGFGRAARHVTLNGEAYFEVPHATGTAFVVRTGTTTVRVLGTAFDVQHYPTDTAVQVAVTMGKVTVGGEAHPHPVTTLTTGMIGTITDSITTVAETGTGHAAQSAAWTTGHLVFHKAPTPTVLAALTRWYGFEFRLADSTLARYHLTVDLSTESSSTALATLKSALGVELTFDGNIVTLRKHDDAHIQRLSPRIRGEMLPSSHTTEAGR